MFGGSGNRFHDKATHTVTIDRIAAQTGILSLGLATAAGAQVASLQLSPARVSATAGDTVQFTLIAKDSAERTITAPNPLWLVGPFEIAAVSQTGLARTFRPGDARVMVRVAGKPMRSSRLPTPTP